MNIDNQIDIGMGAWQKKRKTSAEIIANNKSIEKFAISKLSFLEREKYRIKKK